MSPQEGGDAPLVMERIGSVSNTDRSFDREFWCRQGPAAIFAAAWELVLEAQRWKGQGDAEPTFQRSVERFQSVRR